MTPSEENGIDKDEASRQAESEEEKQDIESPDTSTIGRDQKRSNLEAVASPGGLLGHLTRMTSLLGRVAGNGRERDGRAVGVRR